MGEPLPKSGKERKERKERKDNQGGVSNHRTSGHRQDDNQKKTYDRKDSVTVLGMVCEKMTERVQVVRQQEEDRRIREEGSTVDNLHDDDSQDRRNRKIIRVLQTRERSDRSQT
jgi:hypothetical protein